MSVPELVEAFDFARVNKSAAIFDVEKLAWINSNAISSSSSAELMPYFKEGLREAGLWQHEFDGEKAGWIHQILDLVKERSRLTTDLARDSRYFFEAPSEYDEKAVKKRCKGDDLHQHVEALAELLNGLDQWTAEEIERQLRDLADRLGLGAGKLIHPLRIGVTGQGVTPDVFTICQLVGKEETVPRLRRFSDYLRTR
jgi:glutamyl-tRNA synthetase